MTTEDPTQTRQGLWHRAHRRLGTLLIGARARLRAPVTLGARLLALNAAGEVLLVRHSYMPGWQFPGGGVEPGETCAEAALRETREETGVEIATAPELFHVYHNRRLRNRDHVVLYVARDAPDRVVPPGGLEILEVRYAAPDALPEGTTRATRARLAEVLDGAAVSDHW